jgi:hypothetical protein
LALAVADFKAANFVSSAAFAGANEVVAVSKQSRLAIKDFFTQKK